MRKTVFPLVATLSVQALVSMAVVTVPVLAPAAAAETGHSVSYTGIFIGLVYGACMAAALVAGPFVQRFGAIRTSQFCLLSCALGLALAAAGSTTAFVLSAILLGFGYGQVTPASSHVLAKSTPPGMIALVFSFKQTGVPLGGALAGAVVPPLLLSVGWRAAALCVTAVCLVVLALAQPLRATLDSDRDPSRALAVAGMMKPLHYTLADSLLRRLALCSFCFASLQLCVTTFLVTYLAVDVGMSLVQAGLMLTAAQSGGVIARIVWGAVADRWGRPMTVIGLIALGMGLAAVITAQLDVHWNWVAAASVCAAFGATAIGWNGVYLAEVARLAPAGNVGVATGGSLFFTYGGVLVGPPAFSLLVEAGVAYASAFVILALPAVACGIWLLVHERKLGSARAAASRQKKQAGT